MKYGIELSYMRSAQWEGKCASSVVKVPHSISLNKLYHKKRLMSKKRREVLMTVRVASAVWVGTLEKSDRCFNSFYETSDRYNPI